MSRPRIFDRLNWSAVPLLAFSWLSYVLFARSTLYLIGFVGNLYVPHQIDGVSELRAHGAQLAVSAADLFVNTLLVLAFAVHHSLFARSRIKSRVTRWIAPVAERSTYVLVASLLLIVLMWQWRPLPQSVWSVSSDWSRLALWGLFAGGWTLGLASSLRLGHSETFGVRPVLRRVQRRPFRARSVETRAMYGVIRHPMYVGFLFGIWATPEMSLGHLQLAVLLTAYILLGRRWEEADLVGRYGDAYRAYRETVPAFLPRSAGSKPSPTAPGAREAADGGSRRSASDHGGRIAARSAPLPRPRNERRR